MKIVSWNIAGGYTFKGAIEDALSYEKENLEYFIDQLGKSKAEIICLQEVHIPTNQNKFPQSDVIAKKLGYKHVTNYIYGGKSHIKEQQQLALATISKLSIQKSYFHKLPNPNLKITRPNGDIWISFDVGFLVTQIDYNGQKVNVLNTHLVPFHYFERDFSEPQFQNIREDISNFLIKLSEEPTIAAGDFNYNNLKNLLPQVFEERRYKEAFEDVETTPGRGQQDHILFTNQFNLQDFKVQKVDADHCLCVATLSL
jgi:endonuclease/exonuclease/phosphatase family metal-dependent hydrolase